MFLIRLTEYQVWRSYRTVDTPGLPIDLDKREIVLEIQSVVVTARNDPYSDVIINDRKFPFTRRHGAQKSCP
jgi:hypothetical protein